MFDKYKENKLQNNLSNIFKNINYSVSAQNFIESVDSEDLNKILNIDVKKFDNKVLTEIYNAFYFYSQKNYAKSLISSFSVIEFMLRKEYSQSGNNFQEARSSELLKWSRNRDIISSKHFFYLEGIRQTRNKVIHDLKECMPEEAKLAMSISLIISKNLSKKKS